MHEAYPITASGLSLLMLRGEKELRNTQHDTCDAHAFSGLHKHPLMTTASSMATALLQDGSMNFLQRSGESVCDWFHFSAATREQRKAFTFKTEVAQCLRLLESKAARVAV